MQVVDPNPLVKWSYLLAHLRLRLDLWASLVKRSPVASIFQRSENRDVDT